MDISENSDSPQSKRIHDSKGKALDSRFGGGNDLKSWLEANPTVARLYIKNRILADAKVRAHLLEKLWEVALEAGYSAETFGAAARPTNRRMRAFFVVVFLVDTTIPMDRQPMSALGMLRRIVQEALLRTELNWKTATKESAKKEGAVSVGSLQIAPELAARINAISDRTGLTRGAIVARCIYSCLAPDIPPHEWTGVYHVQRKSLSHTFAIAWRVIQRAIRNRPGDFQWEGPLKLPVYAPEKSQTIPAAVAQFFSKSSEKP